MYKLHHLIIVRFQDIIWGKRYIISFPFNMISGYHFGGKERRTLFPGMIVYLLVLLKIVLEIRFYHFI